MKQRTRKLTRTFASGLYYTLARNLPPTNAPFGKFSTAFRVALARYMFAQLGDQIDISARVYFGSGSNIRIGSGSGLGVDCEIHGPLTIGRDVMISPQVVVHTRNHQSRSTSVPIAAQGYTAYEPVVIEDDVWVGMRAIVLPGVTIGRGSIVGAGSVVTRDVPPFSVVAGNPARVLRSRL